MRGPNDQQLRIVVSPWRKEKAAKGTEAKNDDLTVLGD